MFGEGSFGNFSALPFSMSGWSAAKHGCDTDRRAMMADAGFGAYCEEPPYTAAARTEAAKDGGSINIERWSD